ncbi:MAG TPA: L-2-hydroxyglutarate oxidase [Jiangellaceae bacterium]
MVVEHERVAIVGGGILGTAVARRLLQVRPHTEVLLFEKEDRLGLHQSGHNSGVVHAGIYYAPGSLKAVLCRRGVGLLREFCQDRGLAYERCGKLIVALDEAEQTRLTALHERAISNGVPGIRLVGAAELRNIEPYVRGIAALHSSETAIVDFAAVTRELGADVERLGGSLRLEHHVLGIAPDGAGVRVLTDRGVHRVDSVLLCAGLHSDVLARRAGDGPAPRIVPFRGSYLLLRPDRRHLVHGLIYPVPDPGLPFLGVHLTRRIDGEVLVGPNAVLALSREGYRMRHVDLAHLGSIARSPEFRHMARRHWRAGVREIVGSTSKRAFARIARRYIPQLRADDLVPGPSGVRAQAVDPDGTLVDDFRISRLGPVTAVRNAPSPGATSSLAIAEYVVDAHVR